MSFPRARIRFGSTLSPRHEAHSRCTINVGLMNRRLTSRVHSGLCSNATLSESLPVHPIRNSNPSQPLLPCPLPCCGFLSTYPFLTQSLLLVHLFPVHPSPPKCKQMRAGLLLFTAIPQLLPMQSHGRCSLDICIQTTTTTNNKKKTQHQISIQTDS